MIIRLILVVAAFGLVAGGIVTWKQQQAQQAAARMAAGPPPATIAATEVSSESWQPRLTSVGSLVATQGVAVTNEIAGQVKTIRFRSGMQVEAGEVLLELEDSVDRAQLEGALAEQRLTEIRFNRSRELLKKNAVSKADFDESEANLDNARARVSYQRELVSKKRIRAPFSGRLGIRQVDVGEYLPPGSAIVPLQALDPIYADYSLSEQNLDKLSEGQQVAIRVKSYPERQFSGEISALNPGVEPETRTIRVRATLENPDRLLRPGMFAEVETLLPQREEVLTLPRTAITYAPYGNSVFVIEEQEGKPVVRHVQVTTGEVRNDRVEIISGLHAGQLVVSAGQVKLRNGQPVRIDNSVQLDPVVSKQ